MKARFIVAAALFCGLTAGCAVGPEALPSMPQGTAMLVPETIPPPSDPVQELLDSMTIDQKIGQLLMVSLDRQADVSSLDSLIQKGLVTGVLLLANGWDDAEVLDVSNAIRGQAEAQPIGLYLAVDQEGGNVQRLSGSGFSKIPTAAVQGTWSAAKLTKNATDWALELNAVGVNLDLAPVTDTVPPTMLRTNKPIGALGRQFGTDPKVVSAHSAAFIQGMNDGGVQACIKHFPGLGRITGNTDTSTVGITDDTTKAGDSYVAAFKTAIQAEPAMVMISMATYSQIDAKHPAVFSSAVITGLLRDKIGWNGVVISDAMNAAAVKSTAVGQRGVKFVQAGGDIALFTSVSDVDKAASAMKKLAATDQAFAAQIDAAVARVLTAKAAAGLLSTV